MKRKDRTHPIYREIGHRIAIVRVVYGGPQYTQKRLAQDTGLSHSKLANLESGQDPVSLPDLKKICDVFAIPATLILKGLL